MGKVKPGSGVTTWRTPAQFLFILGVVLLAFARTTPDLVPGLLRGDGASIFAVALVTGLVGLGLWWLKHRDRRKRNGEQGQQMKASKAEALGTLPAVDEAPAPVVPEQPSPRVAVDSSADFQRLLRTVTPRTWVVQAIIGINVAVYVVMVAKGVAPFSPTADSVLSWGADYGPKTLGGQPWRLLASMFLHFGAIHLLMNMYVLWEAGALVERVYGHSRFAATYLAAGVCGGLASLLLHPRVVSAGASGAVFGVYGALGAFLLRHRGSIPRSELSRLSRVALGFVAYNILYGLMDARIDAAAHVGGLLSGAAVGLWLAPPLVPGRRLGLLQPLTVATLAVVLVAAAPRLLPRPTDLAELVNGFLARVRPILDTYDGLVDRAAKEDLGDTEFARQLEKSVIVPWTKAQGQLSVPERWNPGEQKVVDLFIQYGKEQEQAWTSMAVALRGHDEKALAESRAHQAEVERLVKELNQSAP